MNFFALIAPAAIARVALPAIIGSSHDPLLEWHCARAAAD